VEAGKNGVVYMGLVPGPNKADNICGKTKVMGMMQRGSTVYTVKLPLKTFLEKFNKLDIKWENFVKG
jgi:hypothetical protein